MNEDGSEKKIPLFSKIREKFAFFKDGRAEDLELTIFLNRLSIESL